MTTTMTSEHLTEQISQLDERVKALDEQLGINTDLENGLALQRDRDSLTAYRSHLRRQLVETQEREAQAREKEKRDALDAELQSIRDDHAQTTRERVEALNTRSAQLQTDAAEHADDLNRLRTLKNRYEQAYIQRFDTLPGYAHALQPDENAKLTPEARALQICLESFNEDSCR